MKKKILLLALDLDGTLFNTESKISDANRTALKKAIAEGVTVVISTGRPYVGLPLDDMADIGIRYAITANGSEIFRVPEKEPIYLDGIDAVTGCRLLQELYQNRIHLDAFIQGDAYTQASTREVAERLDMPASIKYYILNTRTVVEDLGAYIREKNLTIGKMTLNFMPDGNGGYTDRARTEQLLKAHPEITYVCGGYHNLELTKAGISKSAGLHLLCDYLNIPGDATMACGDSENDLDIISAAGIGVAMKNAAPIVKAAADYIAPSNDEDGVSDAIYRYIL
ncbi:MAG: Cof-type HAD-IIB family hydrolase [Lachnospiraceae bacterium]|nr:Cof-type HAD-IIB family hydrolase [Lachnospiraceae bacterium]